MTVPQKIRSVRGTVFASRERTAEVGGAHLARPTEYTTIRLFDGTVRL